MSIKAVIDTNVLVSAFWSGDRETPPFRIYRAIMARRFIPLYSEEIIAEYADVLHRSRFAFNPEEVAAGNVTATQINAAYQPMDEEADAFEYQVIEFIQQLLKLQGLEGVPQFKRNRISNQLEQVQMVTMEAEYLADETILSLLPNVTPDMIQEILERRDAQEAVRFERTPPDVQNAAVESEEEQGV